MDQIQLICNAHLDISWLWREEEGIAEAVSTFRIAADFCDQYDGFIFCHNEAILYQWVEELEPALFRRIQDLVARGRWHIIGGWFIQPDCNMPSGEAMYRQIERGRKYFMEKFGAAPTTAINFDSFGHSRGLVQILAKNGYDSYIFGRPMDSWMDLPNENFWWVGFDGSKVCAHRSYELYHSLHGEATKKINGYLAKEHKDNVGLVLWGIGNHGGGPSRLDWQAVEEMRKNGTPLVHSTPENFFALLEKENLPYVERNLRPIFPGAYTSQCRVKQRYRELENQLFLTEKMAAHASLACGVPYEEEKLREAADDLLTAQFHDYLPGTTVEPCEHDVLREMDHGLEILRRVRNRAFFALASQETKAEEGTIPMFVYNPHPYPVSDLFDCELQLANQNWNQSVFTEIEVYQNGKRIPSQIEKELGNLTLDWRKRVVFQAELAPFSLNRFDCRPVEVPAAEKEKSGTEVLGKRLHVQFSEETGWPVSMELDGREMLTGPIRLVVCETDEDPWNTNSTGYGHCTGEFIQSAPLRVIEDGPIRTVVEGYYRYENSAAVVRYRIPKEQSTMELSLEVDWQEECRVLKWLVPSVGGDNRTYLGDDMFATETLHQGGSEMVSQRWCGVPGGLAVINEGIYGSSCKEGQLGLTLLQCSVYAGLTIEDRPIVIYDRQLPFIDKGVRKFTIWLDAMDETVCRKAEWHNQKPYALSFFPVGGGADKRPLLTLDKENVQLSAFYREGEDYILRLHETAGRNTDCTLRFPGLDMEMVLSVAAYTIVTARLRKTGTGWTLNAYE